MNTTDDIFDADTGQITLDDYIRKLETLRELVGGNTKVQKWTVAYGRHAAPNPVVAYTPRLDQKKKEEEHHRFWNERHDLLSERGSLVIRI